MLCTKRLVPQSLQQIVFPLGVEPKGGELTELEARGVWIFWFRECCYIVVTALTIALLRFVSLAAIRIAMQLKSDLGPC
jgi:hypothetical protein